MKYEINGRVIETDKPLSDEDIDEIAGQIGNAPSTSAGAAQEAPAQAPEPAFYEIEKQQGLPRSFMDAAKQIGGSILKEGSSPIGLGAVPAAQQLAGQLGADVARGFSTPGGFLPDIGKGPARAAGFLTAAATDPTSYASLGTAAVGKAVAPVARQAGVNAAKAVGIPLTRAEITGGRVSGGIESALEKTLMGSEPIMAARQAGDDALRGFKDTLKTTYGTSLQPSAIGAEIRQGIDSTVGNLKAQAQQIYDNVPNVKVKPENLRQSAEDLLVEQYQLPRSNRDGGLISMLNEYRKLGTKVAKTVDDNLQKTVYTRVENTKTYPSSQALQRVSSDLKDAWRKSVKTGETMGTVGGRDATALQKAIQADLQQVGELRMQLDQANKIWRQVKALDKNSLIKRVRTAGPAEASDLIFNGKKLANVQIAKVAMGPAYKAAKASYFNKLIESPTLTKDLDKMSPEYLTAVFEPVELQALRKVAAIQTIRGAAEKMGGQAGSARTNANIANGGAIVTGLAVAGTSLASLNLPGVLGGLGTAALAYKGPQMAANAYLKYGTKGLSAPLSAPGAGQVASASQPESPRIAAARRLRELAKLNKNKQK